MGVVYAGEHLSTGRRVAIKVMSPHLSENGEAVRRFFREARAAAALEHPNVVEVIDVGEDDLYTRYLVLEFLEGETLSAVIAREKRLSLERTLELMEPIFDALETAHASGIIHRDLKPDNIFISREKTGAIVPKLLDFGIAKVAETGTSGGATQTGMIFGTPMYMSPEQARGTATGLTAAVDTWALGAVVYECVTGSAPFRGQTAHEILLAVLTLPHQPIDQHGIEFLRLRGVIDRALAKDPTSRFSSAGALAEALYLAGGITPPRTRKLSATYGSVQAAPGDPSITPSAGPRHDTAAAMHSALGTQSGGKKVVAGGAGIAVVAIAVGLIVWRTNVPTAAGGTSQPAALIEPALPSPATQPTEAPVTANVVAARSARPVANARPDAGISQIGPAAQTAAVTAPAIVQDVRPQPGTHPRDSHSGRQPRHGNPVGRGVQAVQAEPAQVQPQPALTQPVQQHPPVQPGQNQPAPRENQRGNRPQDSIRRSW